MNNRLAYRRLACVAASLGIVLVAVAVVRGQNDGNVFQTPERELLQHLSRAEEAIQDERYSDAVIELGTLLSSPQLNQANGREGQPQDYFIGPSGESGARKSLKSEAQRLLGALPRAGRELYELQFGADARALLEQAVNEGDVAKLSEVVRRYFHTRAGYEAMVLLGRVHLDRGRPLAAALCFQRVLDSPAAVPEYDPELSILLAACWVDAGMPDKARRTFESVRQRFRDRRLTIDGRQVALSEGEPLDWLERHLGHSPVRSRTETAEWLVHRGNAERNASAAGGLPLTAFRWRAPTATDPNDERLVQELLEGYDSQRLAAIPSIQPLAVNDVILMRTPERLLAVDFATGKRIWEYPWDDHTYASVAQVNRSGAPNSEMAARRTQLQERLWQDMAYGQVSSDGEAVYLLDDLKFATEDERQRAFLPGQPAFRQLPTTVAKTHNQLVALDLEREGYLRWSVGGENGGDEPELAGVFFLGPPLPLLGQLYAIVEIRRELRLVVLDPLTGRQLWSQQLAHVEDTYGYGMTRERRLAGATPSFGDGVLVCPTSSGAVVAVDIASRSLLWGYAYESQPAPSLPNFGFHTSRSRQTTNPGESWADSTVMIADGVVVLTPVEADELLCLDLLTGQPKWPALKRDDDLGAALFAAGTYGGNLVLVGRHEVRAIRLQDGKPAWEAPVELDRDQGEMPSGRGFRSGDHYYLPTTASELVKIDLRAGTIVERAETRSPLGNLICYRDQVISQGVEEVAAFYQVDRLREQVAERLAESPEDAWALARQGELLIHDGKYREALASLRRANQLQPDDEAVRATLVATFLRVLRDDFEIHDQFGTDVAQLIDAPESRLEYLRLVAAGLERRGEPRGAAESYLELADLAELGELEFDPYAARDVPLFDVEAGLSVRLDRWVQARLAELYRTGGEELRGVLDAAVAGRAAQLDRDDEAALRRFLGYYGFHPAADQVRSDLIPHLAAVDRLLEADLLLRVLAANAQPEIAAQAFARAAEAARNAQRDDLAVNYYQTLVAHWPDTVCLDDQTGRERYEQALGDPVFQAAVDSRVGMRDWPYGKVVTNEAEGERSIRRAYPRDVEIPIVSQQGSREQNLSAVFRGGLSSLILTSGSGDELLRLRLDQGLMYSEPRYGANYAAVQGRMLLTVLGQHVVAADLTRSGRSEEAVMWQKELWPSLPDRGLQRQNSVRQRSNSNPLDRSTPSAFFIEDAAGNLAGSAGPVTSTGVILVQGRMLNCVDPLTGVPFWRRQLPNSNVRVFGDDQYLFVAGLADDSALVVRTQDGYVVGNRKIPTWDNRWATYGRHVLAWEQVEGRVRLYLYDPWEEVDVWSESFALGSRGCLFGESGVAVVDPEGRFVVRRLTDDTALVDQPIDPLEGLLAIQVVVSGEQLLLATETRARTNSSNRASIQPLSRGLPTPMINGPVYAFDLATGRSNWTAPALIETYSLPMNQPHDVPTLWLLRHVTTRDSLNAPNPSDMTSVLCLDRRDGRILLAKEGILGDPGMYDFEVDRGLHTVTLSVAGQQMSVRFTDEPTSPEPPAQAGFADAEGGSQNRLSRIAGAVMRAILGEQEAPQDAPQDAEQDQPQP